MSERETEIHADMFGETISVDDAETAGAGSALYHEDDVPALANERDDRTKTVIVNRDLIPAAGDLLVDLVTYGPGVEIPNHYHEETDHFFYVLEGEGVIEIEGEAFPLERGTVAWIGEEDRHRLYTRDDQRMKVLEYFSNNDHPATRVEGEGHTWRSADGG